MDGLMTRVQRCSWSPAVLWVWALALALAASELRVRREPDAAKRCETDDLVEAKEKVREWFAYVYTFR
jgi:hypothetical protein